MAGTGKSDDAFRTIGEVSDWLETPAHVLRFWESKFTQINPVKRAGGRRYYRPEDIALLGGIKFLLHEEGMTIKGVQKLLREQGVRHVSALSPRGVPGAVQQVTGTADDRDREVQDKDGQDAAPPPAGPHIMPQVQAPQPPTEPPAPPAPRAGVLAPILRADPALIRRRRARIAPVLARLEALRLRRAEG